MELPETVTTVIEAIREGAGVESVYGEPIERDDRTVLPVARVAYGFGGGFGEGPNDEADPGGSGVGGGCGVLSSPVGAIEITDDGTLFIRFGNRIRLAGTFALGVVLGAFLSRRRN
ncbi:MAG: spore germination protein GerW family protein [Halorhabdus sp.]